MVPIRGFRCRPSVLLICPVGARLVWSRKNDDAVEDACGVSSSKELCTLKTSEMLGCILWTGNSKNRHEANEAAAALNSERLMQGRLLQSDAQQHEQNIYCAPRACRTDIFDKIWFEVADIKQKHEKPQVPVDRAFGRAMRAECWRRAQGPRPSCVLP
eukprot:symbB.v1.2.008538.t1/scaffold538.1/size242405/5